MQKQKAVSLQSHLKNRLIVTNIRYNIEYVSYGWMVSKTMKRWNLLQDNISGLLVEIWILRRYQLTTCNEMNCWQCYQDIPAQDVLCTINTPCSPSSDRRRLQKNSNAQHFGTRFLSNLLGERQLKIPKPNVQAANGNGERHWQIRTLQLFSI